MFVYEDFAVSAKHYKMNISRQENGEFLKITQVTILLQFI
jgi:hypothetical protein